MNATWSQSSGQTAIVASACLGMVYTQLTMSPATIEYARGFGASGFHIGLLGAVPAVMLLAQFVAAIAANHLHSRRKVWLSVSLLQRLSLVPVAVAAVMFKQVPDETWIWLLVISTVVNHALLNFCLPLWLSWMGDYLPHKGLSQFWGKRHLWMQWTGAAALLAGAMFLQQSGFEIRKAFAVLIVIGAVFGVADVLLFLRIEEPPVTRVPEPKLRDVLAAPFRERGFRSFIGYACFWHFAAMVGAPFITLYLLARLEIDLYHVLLLWTFSWIGGAVLSQKLGGWTERFGNRPVLVICTALKSTNMIALLLTPNSPTLAFWILVPVFMLDALLNAGIAIASNGFLLKNSPAENRTMYIAAGTALAGMVGGVTAVAAGWTMTQLDHWQWTIGGGVFDHFHLLFAASLLLRTLALIFALKIHEPHSRSTHEVVTLLVGATPLRMLRFPVGLYRSFRDDPVEETANESDQ